MAQITITRQYQGQNLEFKFKAPKNYPWCLDKLLDLCTSTFDSGDDHGSEAYFENMDLKLDLWSSGTQGCGAQVLIKLDNGSEFMIED